jgi:bifunctional DNase/RNase
MPQWLEVSIDSVRTVADARRYSVIVLKEQGGDRYLHVWTGPCEGALIAAHRKGVPHGRPLTFDLMKTLAEAGGLHIDQVAVTGMKDGVFLGAIAARRDGAGNEPIEIDCRPSDAINLAIRMHLPVFVNAEVMDAAGKPTPEVSGGKKLRNRRLAGVLAGALVWGLLAAVLSWEPGGENPPPQLLLFVPAGLLLGMLQGMVEGVAVRAVGTAVLLSVVWGARSGWTGAAAGAVLGFVAEPVIRRLGKAISSAMRRDAGAPPGESS